ncbi:MAG: histidinol-phosphatase HisJ [Deltaproteobacteria bacterium]|nr:histidinol-phosphatase HisJ [Deltaproteobacteria bacterium]
MAIINHTILKWDGHTHSEFCKHGKADKTEEMIKRAIDLGFEKYSVTEHAPLPEGAVLDQQLVEEYALDHRELQSYFEHVGALKEKYKKQIQILCGLEVDYLLGWEDYTRDLLEKNRQQLDECILSLHFLTGNGGLRCVDWNPEDLQDGLIKYYGSIQKTHLAYWNTLQKMLTVDFNFDKNIRIGHMGLINIFQKHFSYNLTPELLAPIFEKTFQLIHTKNYQVDYNVSGKRKSYCKEVYVSDAMLLLCEKYNIPVIYGSDAHAIEQVGMDYSYYEKTFAAQLET